MYIITVNSGCFAHGLYLEGAGWDVKKTCLIRQRPKQLIQELPVLKIIPIESHRLKLQVNECILAICMLKSFCMFVVNITMCEISVSNLSHFITLLLSHTETLLIV